MTEPHRRTILIVEADDALREGMASALAEAGFEVETHPDYRGALALLDSAAPLDCMITALVLPKGTPHGIALGNMALVKRPRLPLLFVATSMEEAEWVDERRRPLVLLRPFGTEALLQAIERVCGPDERLQIS